MAELTQQEQDRARVLMAFRDLDGDTNWQTILQAIQGEHESLMHRLVRAPDLALIHRAQGGIIALEALLHDAATWRTELDKLRAKAERPVK